MITIYFESIIENIILVFTQLIFGKKEFCLLNKRLRAFTARMCSNPLIDRLCVKALLYIGGCNEKNLNVVCIPLLPLCIDLHLS